MTNFSKECPQCNSIIYYTRKDNLLESINKNRLCRKCSKKNTIPSFIINGVVSKDVLEKIKKTQFKSGHRPLNADTRKGKTFEELYDNEKATEYKNKLSKYLRTQESNEKRRIKSRDYMIQRLNKLNKNFHPPYNPKACKILNEIMLEQNIFIQHAENGGEYFIKELGFWVDGYDKENNTIYEYDEKHHFKNGILSEKDINRQILIINHLKCKFIRIKD